MKVRAPCGIAIYNDFDFVRYLLYMKISEQLYIFFLFKLSDRLSDKLEGFTGHFEIYRKSTRVQHLWPSQLAHIMLCEDYISLYN